MLATIEDDFLIALQQPIYESIEVNTETVPALVTLTFDLTSNGTSTHYRIIVPNYFAICP